MEKPTIIVFSTAYDPFVGGAEIAVQEVIKRLSARFHFVILTARIRRGLPAKEVRRDCVILRLGFGMVLDKWLLPILCLWPVMRASRRSGHRRMRCVFWGMDISQASVAAACMKLLFPRQPFVVTIQYGESEERLLKGRWGLIERGLRFMLHRADQVTAISNYLLQIGRDGGYRGPLTLVHNGVDLAKFQHRNASRKRDKLVVLTTSRLVSKNAVDVLIRAVHLLKGEFPTLECRIAGDGPERQALELLTRQLEIANRVTFLGLVQHNEIPSLLHDADIFVRASRSEGMGNSFVEALAAGVPIIGTPVGGITDIIENRQTGLFAAVDDPKDLAAKIKRLFTDPMLARRIVQKGSAMVTERFSWERIAQQYESVFKAVYSYRRVLIVTGLFPPDIGGPATYSRLLMDELPLRGVNAQVLWFGSVRHLPKLIRHIVFFFRVLVRGWRHDIIFAQDPVSVGLPAASAARILDRPFVIKIVGDYAWEQAVQRFGVSDLLDAFLKKKYGWRVELLRRIECWVVRQADVIIVPSKYLQRVVRRWGVFDRGIVVIPNAVEVSGQQIDKQNACKLLGLDPAGTLLISSGRLVPWKGFLTLIDVVQKLLPAIPDLQLYIIGSGPDEKMLQSAINARRLQNAVHLLGRVSHEQMLRYLAAGDIFLLNTGYEGMAHVVLEAMAMRVPVVTTPVGGNPEVIEDRVSGLLVEHDDVAGFVEAVMAFTGDKKFRRQVVEQAEITARRFSKERMLGEISTLLTRL
ncbi:MAG: glycosyltransferase family 4 protein [Candidatus Sungbacteria bacterium]|nr:glycosyltransferase family 4 protein [Candidatus Sungbacteria bacterium]